jgi:membrane fusion protein (multidrug efflux system)
MSPENTPPAKKKSPVRFIIIGIVAVLAIFFIVKRIRFSMNHETTDNAQVETNIVPVLPRVSGYVKNIAVGDYDSVTQGQLVMELDDAELQAQLSQMEADLLSAKADIDNARAQLGSTNVGLGVNRGSIDLSKVRVAQAREDFQRNQKLFADQAITRKQLDDSRFAYEQAQQASRNTQTELQSASSRVSVQQTAVSKAEASLAAREAAIEQQKLKISYTKIYAPASGRLGKKSISAGQFVQAGAPLFSIVSDSVYWIVANFKETQIKQFHEGMPVKVTLDAYPDAELDGVIESLSEATGARFSLLPPDNASGNFVKVTQRIPVRISLPHPGKMRGSLRAGLSAEVIVPLTKS